VFSAVAEAGLPAQQQQRRGRGGGGGWCRGAGGMMGSGSEEGEVQRNPSCTRSGEMSQARQRCLGQAGALLASAARPAPRRLLNANMA